MGPDFQNALIAIDGEKWAGQVEIHINSSDWFKHNHHLDSTYDGTILHVVYTYDADVTRTNGTIIPCLALNTRISKSLITTYDALTNNSHKIPCEMVLSKVASQTKLLTIEARAIDRLEARVYTHFSKTTNLPKRLAGSPVSNDIPGIWHACKQAAVRVTVETSPDATTLKIYQYRVCYRSVVVWAAQVS